MSRKSIGAIIFVLILLAVGYFVFSQKTKIGNNTQFTNREQSSTANVCAEERDSITSVVISFESLQMKRDASGVLKLFTAPENAGDSSTQVHLSGSDAAGPRLYSSGQTNFNEPSYKILETPQKNSLGTCTVKVEEQRSYYPQGVGGEFGPARPYVVYFIMKKQNNNWMIDSYLDDDGSVHKFSGWGY